MEEHSVYGSEVQVLDNRGMATRLESKRKDDGKYLDLVFLSGNSFFLQSDKLLKYRLPEHCSLVVASLEFVEVIPQFLFFLPSQLGVYPRRRSFKRTGYRFSGNLLFQI